MGRSPCQHIVVAESCLIPSHSDLFILSPQNYGGTWLFKLMEVHAIFKNLQGTWSVAGKLIANFELVNVLGWWYNAHQHGKISTVILSLTLQFSTRYFLCLESLCEQTCWHILQLHNFYHRIWHSFFLKCMLSLILNVVVACEGTQQQVVANEVK